MLGHAYPLAAYVPAKFPASRVPQLTGLLPVKEVQVDRPSAEWYQDSSLAPLFTATASRASTPICQWGTRNESKGWAGDKDIGDPEQHLFAIAHNAVLCPRSSRKWLSTGAAKRLVADRPFMPVAGGSWRSTRLTQPSSRWVVSSTLVPSPPCGTAQTPLRRGLMLGRHFLGSGDFSRMRNGLRTGLGVSIDRSGTRRRGSRMRTHFETTARVPMWVAGITICLLAAAGIVATARSIPASYANIPGNSEPSVRDAAPSVSAGAHAMKRQAEPAAGPTVNKRRNGVRCSDCGVVESIRKIERSGDIGGQGTPGVNAAENVSGDASGAAIATDAAKAMSYEITVRFRDGSRTVLNEATPRSWRLGSRVIVIGRSNAAND